jgi:hypothetical protein
VAFATVLLVKVSTQVVADPVLLDESSAAIVPLEQENRLVVRDLFGDLTVRLGKGEAVQFMAVDPEDRDRGIALALWQDGRSLLLRPVSGTEPEPVRMEVTVPQGFGVEIEARDSAVQVRGTEGFLEVTGSGLDLRAHSVIDLDLDVVDSRVDVQGVTGEADLDLREVEGSVARVAGSLRGRIAGGSFQVGPVEGTTDLDVEGGRTEITASAGRLRMTADSAEIVAQDLAQGGEFRLTGTTLALRSCAGDLDVETDHDVAFESNEGDLHVNSWGGSLRGRGSKGLVEIKTSSAVVNLEEVEGPVRVQGDGLEVRLKQIGGELIVMGSSSRIEVSGASAPVTIQNEFGDVFVEKASAGLSVFSRDGVVHATGLGGPAEIEAEGAEVRVGWVTMQADKDSVIRNTAGTVIAQFPVSGGGGCMVEAVSNYGRVETDLPGIRVSGEEDRASGSINRRSRPSVRIEAEDGVRLLGSSGGSADEDS